MPYPIVELEDWHDLPDDPVVLDKVYGIAFAMIGGGIYFSRVDPKKVEESWSQAVRDRGGLEHRVGWRLVHGKFPVEVYLKQTGITIMPVIKRVKPDASKRG